MEMESKKTTHVMTGIWHGCNVKQQQSNSCGIQIQYV